MASTTVRADQSGRAWCNWLLVTQHCVAFIKGCCIMWLRRAGSSLLMRWALRNPTADSKHLRLVKKCFSRTTGCAPLSTASGSLASSAHCDKKRKKKKTLLGEQRARCVISLREACHSCTGGSPDMKGGWREMQRRQTINHRKHTSTVLRDGPELL